MRITTGCARWRKPRLEGIHAKRFATALLALAWGVSASGRQPPASTFTNRVDLVTLDVRIVDRSGQFVDGLTKDDLKVFEDGREQTIATFERVLQAAEGVAARANVAVDPLDPRRRSAQSFGRIVAETSSYSLVGYVPTNAKHDGTFARSRCARCVPVSRLPRGGAPRRATPRSRLRLMCPRPSPSWRGRRCWSPDWR